MKFLCAIALCVVVLALSSCAAILSRCDFVDVDGPFPATKTCWHLASFASGDFWADQYDIHFNFVGTAIVWMLVAIDLPFSVASDIVFLPWDWWMIAREEK